LQRNMVLPLALALGDRDRYFIAIIARQVGAGRVIGFDLDPAMLEQAQAACEGMSNCSWLLGDAMTLSSLLATPASFKLETRVELPSYHYGAILIRVTA